MRRAVLTLVLAGLLVVSGCTAPATDRGTTPGEATTTDARTTTGGSATTAKTFEPNHPADPDSDRIGWEDGYWYDETLSLTPGDGYNRSEIDRVLARTMARVERIRRLEFEENVSVEVISRAEYRNRSVFDRSSDPFEDQAYEATFLVNESTHAATAFNAVYGGSVAGYYYDGQIVLVSDDPTSVDVSRSTLAHELVHALQDQHDLRSRAQRGTSDARAAATSLSEGDANYVMDRYLDRCGVDWQCIPPPSSGSSSRSFNRGLFLTVFVPYSEGPQLVAALRDRGGWDAVNAAYEDPPVSTEQVIHPGKYPEDVPARVTIRDRSNDEWRPIEGRSGRTDTLGEAVLYATFWYNGIVPEDHLTSDDTRYNYSYPPSAGWDGDAVAPYENDGEYGYVFATTWDTESDAEAFRQAYVNVIQKRGGERVSQGVYRIPDDRPFGDAFRVTRDGDRVVIVNAPSVDELDGIRPA